MATEPAPEPVAEPVAEPAAEPYKDIFDSIIKKDKFCENLHIDTIDGIRVYVCMDKQKIYPTRNGILDIDSDELNCIRIYVNCCWKDKKLYHVYCENAKMFEHFFTETLPNLKYSFLHDELWDKEPHKKFAYDILNLIPKNNNITFTINECSVCLEPTKIKTCCGHSLCYKCESKIKNKKCPICRNHYEHNDNDNDDY